MSVEMLGVVGVQSLSKGSKAQPSLAPNGSLVMQDDFAAAVERGRCFTFANQTGTTSAAGLSGTTPGLCLANPGGSGVRGRLWYAGCSVTVAAATAGAVWLAAGTNTIAAVVTGTLATAHRNLKLGGENSQGNKIVAFLQPTLPAAPVAISVLGALLTGAITTQILIGSIGRWFNGGVLIEPGTNISIQTGVATGASGLFAEFVWEEVDI